MRFSPPRLLRTVILAAAAVSAGSFSAEAQTSPPAIAPARHFQFTAQPGTAWYLDGSSDGIAWSQLAGPFFGTGSLTHHYQNPGAASKFRLRYVDPATVGAAPVVASGLSLALEKNGSVMEVVFISAVRGILWLDDSNASSFTYTWLKTSANEAEAILTDVNGKLRLLRLRFKDRSLGSWSMEDIPSREAATSLKQPVDGGAFSLFQGRFLRGQSGALMPGTLAGRSLILNEAGKLSHVTFVGETSATMTTSRGAAVEGTYAYDPESHIRGELRLNLNGRSIGLRLNMDAPGLGHFEDIPATAGQTPARFGTFTLPHEQNPPINPNCPPPSIAGSSFTIQDSSPVTLTFLADGSGYTSRDENGTIKIVGFFYSYSNTGGGTAKVSLVFPGGSSDAIDDYEMVWKNDCSGEFKRQSFTNGKTTGTSKGTFGPGEAAAFGGGPGGGVGM